METQYDFDDIVNRRNTNCGGNITSGLNRNRLSNVVNIVSTFSGVATVPPPAAEKPAIVYTIIQMIHPGIVV